MDGGTVNLCEVLYIPRNEQSLQELTPVNLKQRRDSIFLYFTSITAMLTYMVFGAQAAWTSSAILKMKSNDTSVNPLGRLVETYELSKFFITAGMVQILGSLILPKLADIMGRKRSLWLIGFLVFISYVGLSLSRNFNLMIACYSSGNAFLGGVMGILPMYLTEICEDHNRAKHGCLMSAFLPIGQLYTYLIGPLFSYTAFTLFTGAPLIPFLLLFFFAPESPVFCLQKGKKLECKKALKKLRSNKTEKELEYDFLKISDSLEKTDEKRGYDFIQLFGTKEGRLGLLLACLPILVQFSSGVPILMMLMAPIFAEFRGSSISGSTIAICAASVKMSFFICSSMTVQKFGRRPLLLISCCGAALPISFLGVFFYLKRINSPFVYQYTWIPLFCVLTFLAIYSIGLGPIPTSITGEMFPSNIRSTGCAVVNTLCNIFLTIYVSTYPILADLVGTHWCMWMFGSCCFGGGLVIYFLLPETKGKSVTEIQKLLRDY